MTMIYKQYGQVPFTFINGLGLANNATTPLTQLDVAAGLTIDSTDTFQMYLPAKVTINAANTGLNGIDTGALAASKVYAVYLVADPVTNQATGAMISLSLTGPLMPFGYLAWALIGYVVTDASIHFLPAYWTDNDSATRLMLFDAPQETGVTSGAQTSYTNVDLTKFVPLVNNIPVWLATVYTPNAASDTLKLQPGNATGDAVTITAQVAHVVVTTNSLVLAQTVAISTVPSPTVNYKVSSGSDAVAVYVAGFQYNL